MDFHFKNIDIVGVISGLSTKNATITNRHSHTFIYKIDGESLYLLRGKEVHLSPKTLLFIPENETYSFRKISKGDSRYCLINFHADIKTETFPTLFKNLAGVNVLRIFKQMEQSLLLGREIGHLECMSLFYSFLARLAKISELPYTTSLQKNQIIPALEYLEKHLFDISFKVSDLPGICGISAPTFRRIFISKFGTNPKNYIIERRLLYAEQILKSGEYINIAQVAETVGFEDSLYFSKCFKAYFGVSPSKIKNHSHGY